MPVSTPAITFTRDRPTWFVYMMLATFATYLYGLSSALPTLRAELGVTQAIAGSPRHRHGRRQHPHRPVDALADQALRPPVRRLARIAGMNAGMVLVGFGPTLAFTLAGYSIAGGFAAIALYVSMAALSDHHGPAGPASISEANAVGVLAGIPATYGFSVLAESVLGWRAAMFIPVVLTAVLAFGMGRVWFPEVPAERAVSRVRRPFGWRFHFAGAVLLCCVAVEFVFNLWAVELFSQRTGLSLAEAATGLTRDAVAASPPDASPAPALTLRFPVWQVFLGTMAVTLGRLGRLLVDDRRGDRLPRPGGQRRRDRHAVPPGPDPDDRDLGRPARPGRRDRVGVGGGGLGHRAVRARRAG